MSSGTHTEEKKALAVVFEAEVEYYFPDPADVFEDCLTALLELERPLELGITAWRQLRVAFLEEHAVEAEPLIPRAEELTTECLRARCDAWPYEDEEEEEAGAGSSR